MSFRLCNIRLLPHETEVMPGLSVTPTDMELMTMQGRAVASHQMDTYNYSDGYRTPSDLPLPERRGRDMNDNWEMVKQFGNKVRAAKARKAFEKADAAVAGQEGVE